MEANDRFFTSKEIYARLASTYPRKIEEFNVVNVMRWCAELVTEIIRDPLGRIKNNNIKCGFGPTKLVQENKVPLPPFIFKLEAVYNELHELIGDYLYQGDYLIFPDSSVPTSVYIDYYTIPLDDSGFPLIKRGYEQACFAYCVYKMFLEDSTSIPPRIQQWKWMEIVQDKDWEVEAACRSWEDINENEAQEIMKYLIDPNYLFMIGKMNNTNISGSETGSKRSKY